MKHREPDGVVKTTRDPTAIVGRFDRAPVARLTDIGLRYGKTHALDAVSLDLPAGCMVGLIGPDGVGKSSLLALIAGARQIQQGQVEVLGGDMADAGFRRAACPRIAYMPQGLGKNLYPTLSVFENTDFFARLFGQGRAERHRRIAELLESIGLGPFPDRPADRAARSGLRAARAAGPVARPCGGQTAAMSTPAPSSVSSADPARWRD